MSTHDPEGVAALQAEIEAKQGRGTMSSAELAEDAMRRHIEKQGGHPVDPEDGRTTLDLFANPHAFRMVLEAEETREPLFCFRARDFFSIQVIAFYANIVEQYGPDDADFHRNIVDALAEFKEWQKDHITEVRYPD